MVEELSHWWVNVRKKKKVQKIHGKYLEDISYSKVNKNRIKIWIKNKNNNF